MSYTINHTEQALEDADRLERNEPSAYKRFMKLMEELAEYPTTGTGHPEPLKVSAYGHYDDK